MTRVALRGLLGRKVRAALTAFSIVLGVAMVSGAFVLSDTISRAFDSIFASAYRETDAVVTGKSLVDWSASGNPTVSEELLARVRALAEVEAASGGILDLKDNSTQAKLVNRDGEPIQSSGNPTFGFGIDPDQPRFNPMRLAEGEWARGRGEVVIDREAAESHGFAVGDRIRIATSGPVRSFRISGLATYGDVDTLGGATFAVWDVPTARSLLDIDGFTAISVAAKDGIPQERLLDALRDVSGPATTVRTGEEQAEADKEGIAAFVSFIRGFLLAFGGIALLVGAFVIFNTLSITVAQRTRELATLRTLGASRRQVLRSVFLEALMLGVIASAVGIAAGIGLARLLSALFDALGLSLPQSDPVYAARTFAVAAAVGILVTVVAGIFPAVRATRVAPIAAVREGAVLSRKRRAGTIVGAVLLAGGGALVASAAVGGEIGSTGSLLSLAGGGLLLMVGLALVASRLVRVLARVVGFPSRRLGGAAGRLAAENAVRNPSRTAATAAALMIGLALVAFVATLGAGVKDSFTSGARDQFAADWVITSQNGWTPFPRAAGDAVQRLGGVEATSIRADRGLVGDSQATVNAVDPATLKGLYRFRWTSGSDAVLAQLGADGAVVKEAFARSNGLAVGDRFTLRTPHGDRLRLVVEGVYQPPRVAEMLGGVVIGQAAFDRAFPRPQNAFTLVRGAVSRASIEEALTAFPDAKVQSRDEFVDNQISFIGQLLNLVYVLLALSVVVSMFGMVNTLVLSVFERTRELGMLRAVGMTRRQARRMIRHESVVTALIGAGLGLPLGVAVAAAVTHSLDEYGVDLSIPVGSLAAFTAVAVVAGLIAAIAPARRASRLNVLRALQYE